MDVQTLRKLRTQLLTEAEQITQAKQPGYTVGRKDVLSNFKTVAERMGVTPMQAWGVYFLKHVDSIVAYAKDPKIPQGEAMVGRFADAINYLCLGWALYHDNKGNPFEVPSTVYLDEEFKKRWSEPSKVYEVAPLSGGEERRGGGHPVPDGNSVPANPDFEWHPNPDYGGSNENEPRYLHTWRRLTPFGWVYKSTAHSVPRGEDDGA